MSDQSYVQTSTAYQQRADKQVESARAPISALLIYYLLSAMIYALLDISYQIKNVCNYLHELVPDRKP